MQYENAPPPSHFEQVVVDRTFAAKVKQQAFRYMNQLQGWCSELKASTLIDWILRNRPETVVEIGVYGGKSLVPMAYALKANQKGKIYGIDPWDANASLEGVMNEANVAYWRSVNLQSLLIELLIKIRDFNLEDRIELIQCTSESASPIFEIDFLHIDGNHSDETSYIDVTKWVPFVKKGGYILFDDMTWYENGVFTTARAVEWLDAHCLKIAEFKDVSVWGLWMKL